MGESKEGHDPTSSSLEAATQIDLELTAHTLELGSLDGEGGRTEVESVTRVRISEFPTLLQGAILQRRYAIERHIARGGFGEVYAAYDQRRRRSVALKVTPMSGSFRLGLSAIKGEFSLLSSLVHPNLAEVHDFGFDRRFAFFTQDLVPGVHLDRAGLDDRPEDLLPAIRQLARALDYLHSRGLLHRDVKPSNILYDAAQAHVVLLDFGIAKVFGRDHDKLAGSTGYLSPEAILGQPLDARSDLYALGVTLFRVIEGRLPFETRGRTAQEVLDDHLFAEPPALSERAPEPLRRAIMALLSKDPARRPASGAELCAALGLGDGASIETRESLAGYVLSARYVDANGALPSLEEQLAAGDPSAPLLVTGDGGSGKTRLLSELRHKLQLRGVEWLGLEAGEDGAHALLRDLTELIVDEELARRLGDDDRSELARGAPHLRRRGERLAVPVDPERARAQRVAALARAIALRFELVPGVIAVDDVHQAEPRVIQELCNLLGAVARAGRARAALVLAGRENSTTFALAQALGCAPHRTVPLARDAARQLVAAMLGDAALIDGTPLDAALVADEASPLWIQESLRLATEEGRLARAGGAWVLEGVLAADSLETVLERRLAAQSAAAQTLAAASAVLVEPATLTELAHVAGLGRRAAPILRELVGAAILDEVGRAPRGITYAMQERFRQLAVTRVDRAALRAMQRRAAERFETTAHGDPLVIDRAARHHLRAGDKPRAARAWRTASEVAEQLGRPDLALRYLDSALPLDPRPTVARELRRFDLALSAGETHTIATSLANLQRSRRAANAGERLEIDLRRARSAAQGGDGSGALRLVRRVIAQAAAQGARRARVRAQLLLGELLWLYGDMREARAQYEAAARAGARWVELAARAALGASLAALHVGIADDAQHWAESARAASARTDDVALRSDVLRQLGNVLRERGRSRAAARQYAAAIHAARRAGCFEREAKALNNLGTVYQFLGQVERAMAALGRSVELKLRSGAQVSALVGMNNLGAIQLAVGDFAAARATLGAVVATHADDALMVTSIAGSNLADIDLLEGHFDRAIQRYDEALASCRRRAFAAQETHVLAGLIRALLLRDGPGDAERVQSELVAFEALNASHDMAEAARRLLTTRALIHDRSGDLMRALDDARAAVAIDDRVTRFSDVFATPIEAAWIHALIIRRTGSPEAGAHALEAARRALHEVADMLAAEERARLLRENPIFAAIERGELELPPGTTFRPGATA